MSDAAGPNTLAIAGPDGEPRDYHLLDVTGCAGTDRAARVTWLLVSDRDEVYRVAEGKALSCTCPHFVHRGKTDGHRLGPCKHIRRLVETGRVASPAALERRAS